MSDREADERGRKTGASLMRRVDAADGAGSSPRRLAESGGTADCRHSKDRLLRGNHCLIIRDIQPPPG